MSHQSYKTPHQFRGVIPENLPPVTLERVHLAMRKEYRLPWLAVKWSMTAARALAPIGKPKNWNKRRGQAFLGAVAGVSRGTMNLWLSYFSEPVSKRWDEERRREHSGKMKARARSLGKSVSDDRQIRNRDLDRLGVLLHKDSAYGCSLMYSENIPAELKPDVSKRMVCLICEEIRDRLEQGDSPEILAERFQMTLDEVEANAAAKKCPHVRCRDAQMYARAYGTKNFNPRAEVNGYGTVLGCLWHPSHPDANPCLCKLGQLKLAFQEVCPHCAGKGYVTGLRWNNRESKWEESFLDIGPRILGSWLQFPQVGIRKRGYIQKRQRDIAEALGVDPNTIYAWRKKLEWLGYLKIVAGEIIRDCTSCGQSYVQSRDHGRRDDGAVCRCGGTGPVRAVKPDKWLWWPDQVLDPEQCGKERDRFNSLALAASKSKRWDDKTLLPAAIVHRRILDSWQGNQHNMQAFWNEAARQTLKEGAPRALVDHLYPQRE